MPRVARIVVPGVAHHVTQRGNNRQHVFFTDRDRRLYLELLREHSQRFGLSVRGYCLMTNHVHLVVVPNHERSLAEAIGRTHWRYTQYINRLHGRRGHLWQSRFFSCALDDEHEEAAIRYAERNVTRARLVRLPWKYAWSSAAAHCGMSKDVSGVLDATVLVTWLRRYPHHAWQRIVRQAEDETLVLRVRSRTCNGRPLGSDRFIAKLETRLNRRLRDPRMGRPRKKKKSRAKAGRRKTGKKG